MVDKQDRSFPINLSEVEPLSEEADEAMLLNSGNVEPSQEQLDRLKEIKRGRQR